MQLLKQMAKCGPAGLRACSLGLVGLGFRVRNKVRLGIVLWLATVLGLAHFTYCHIIAAHTKTRIYAGLHFTHNQPLICRPNRQCSLSLPHLYRALHVNLIGIL